MYLTHIIIGEAKKPLEYVENVWAEKELGLKGDRYYYKKGTFNKPQLNDKVRSISLIDYDSLAECNKRVEATLDFKDLRRNLVIQNLDYEVLNGKLFSIGEAHFKLTRTCPPCKYLSRLLDKDMMLGLKYIGGYRAEIMKSGTITIGDELILL